MATDPLFGWDLTFKSIENNVSCKADVIIAFIHFNLMKRGFRSIGVGDEVNIKFENDIKTTYVPKSTKSDVISLPVLLEVVHLSDYSSITRTKNDHKKIHTHQPWWDAECAELWQNRKAAERSFKLKMSLNNFNEYKSAVTAAKRVFRKKKNLYLRTLSGDEEKSELLPTGWNDKENYTLRYILEDKLYILHGLTTDGNLIINLMRSEDLVVSNLAVNIDDTVKEMKGPIDKMMPNHKDLMFNIKRDLIDTVTTRNTNTAETQTSGESSRRPHSEDPLRATPRPRPSVQPDVPNLWNPPSGLGRADLDPFAPGGGGMIFNPFSPRRDIENPGLGVPGGLPRGAVPPGARFDPFAPPGVGPMPGRGRRPPPPDADHLPPPGFNDDMFM